MQMPRQQLLVFMHNLYVLYISKTVNSCLTGYCMQCCIGLQCREHAFKQETKHQTAYKRLPLLSQPALRLWLLTCFVWLQQAIISFVGACNHVNLLCLSCAPVDELLSLWQLCCCSEETRNQLWSPSFPKPASQRWQVNFIISAPDFSGCKDCHVILMFACALVAHMLTGACTVLLLNSCCSLHGIP